MPVPVELLNQKMTAPGQPFEMETVTIRGIPTRVWKHAPASLRQILENTLQFAARDYLVYEDERLTYAEHYRQVCCLAHRLVDEFGIQPGDRVALVMRNYPEWPVVFWAVVSIGAVVVPLNAWWTATELSYALADCGARALFADGERAAALDSIADQLPKLKHRVVARHDAELPGWHNWSAVLTGAQSEASLPPVTIEPDADATIFYTSGTTGKPKGALSTHRNICVNQISGLFLRARTELRYGRTPEPPAEQMGQLISVPLFHVTGCLAMLCASTLNGYKIVFMRKWDADQAIEIIAREKLNSFGGVPSMPLQVLESPLLKTHDLSSVRAVQFGGGPPPPELAARVKQAFPNAAPSNGCGLTETSGVATANVAEDYLAKPLSAGLPPPVTDIKIVAADGSEQPPGEVGEIWIKGPQVIKGYWNNPEANAETFSDGWLHSGDLGYLDAEGFLFVVDRAKDMLIRGGENIYCIEVENALYEHPAVLDAAVVGLPDPVLGERVAATVQVRGANGVSEKVLQNFVAERLAAYKVPARIDLQREPLPRNANGKVVKTAIRERMAR